MKNVLAIIVCLTLKGCVIQNAYKAKEPLEVYGVGRYDTLRFADIPAGEVFYVFNNDKNNPHESRYQLRGLYLNNYLTIIVPYGSYSPYRRKYLSKKKYRSIMLDGLNKPSLFYYSERKSQYNWSGDSGTGSSGSYRSIQTGPRGGRYYINSRGNKTYIKR